jgi:hypothetical protein
VVSDGYLSLRASGTNRFGDPRGEPALVFVDLGEGLPLDRLRELPSSMIIHGATLLVRAREELGLTASDVVDPRSSEAEELHRLLVEDWKLGMNAGLLHQPCGQEPWVETIQGNPSADWRRARRIELLALLDAGRAIWRPENYHYRLPSGEHAGTFVKVGDAIREPQDAVVLASWLARRMSPGLSFVLDTGTLSAMAEAARRRMREDGFDPGGVAVLDRYPLTDVDVIGAIEHAAGGEGAVCALLSINSSGAVRDRLFRALSVREAAYGKTSMEVLADRGRAPTSSAFETWAQLELHTVGSSEQTTEQSCELCRDTDRAPLVPIDPTTFDGRLPLQVRLLMPATTPPRRAAVLWERAMAVGAVSVEAESSTAVRAHRLDARMGVVVDMGLLLDDEVFARETAARLAEVMGEVGENQQPFFKLDPEQCLILIPRHEYEIPKFDVFLQRLGDVLKDCRVEPFDVSSEFPDELKKAVLGAGQVIAFSLGMVTGTSLQRALVGIQSSRTDHPNYKLGGLVIHARPATSREWQTLKNSYSGVLRAVWLTLLPRASPLAEELAVLQQIDVDDLSPSAAQQYDVRSNLCTGGAGKGPQPVFWGCDASQHLTPNSIFGQRLDVTTSYAAVGAALAHARALAAARSAPEQRVFDMSAMLRSYYDPLIVAAFLRWLAPHEVWWGWQTRDAEQTVTALLNRASHDKSDELCVLVPELLLAGAQGKLAEPAERVVVDHAKRIDWEAYAKAQGAAELGLYLMSKRPRRPTAEQAVGVAVSESTASGA